MNRPRIYSSLAWLWLAEAAVIVGLCAYAGYQQSMLDFDARALEQCQPNH